MILFQEKKAIFGHIRIMNLFPSANAGLKNSQGTKRELAKLSTLLSRLTTE